MSLHQPKENKSKNKRKLNQAKGKENKNEI